MFINHGYTSALTLSRGHFDKLADTIADSVIDLGLAIDPKARMNAQVVLSPAEIQIRGEFKARGDGVDGRIQVANVKEAVRQTLLSAGYGRPGTFFGVSQTPIKVRLSQGIEHPSFRWPREPRPYGLEFEDFVQVFGYAANESPTLLSAPQYWAQQLVDFHESLLPELDWLHPDARAYVGVLYENGVPAKLGAAALSTQHQAGVPYGWSLGRLKEILGERFQISIESSKYHGAGVNPEGLYCLEGPRLDLGCSGKWGALDTNGGQAPFGGTPLAGINPRSIARSGTYFARYLAKQVVARGWARRCILHLECVHMGLRVFADGASEERNQEIADALKEEFDFSHEGIIQHLKLDRPIYSQLAASGYFGRSNPLVPWERIKSEVPANSLELFTHGKPELDQPLPKKVESVNKDV